MHNHGYGDFFPEPPDLEFVTTDWVGVHQSLHHLVMDAPWDGEVLLDRTLDTVLPALLWEGACRCVSVTTERASMPVAFRLYLPEAWANDKARRQKAAVPEEVAFQTRPQIALDQIRRAQERGVPAGIVLADAGYDNDTQFRSRLSAWALPCVAGVQSAVSVWKPGQ